MDVFQLRDQVVGNYANYVRSFLKISDPNIKAFGMSFNASSPITWVVALFMTVAGFFVARITWAWLARAWDEALTVARDKGYHA